MMSGNDFRLYAGVDFSREFLVHYGVGHDKGGHSGRYPWGSSNNVKSSSSGSSGKLYRKIKPGEDENVYMDSQKKLMKTNPYKYLQELGVDAKMFDGMVELATKAIKGQASTMDSHYPGRDEVWDAWDNYYEHLVGKYSSENLDWQLLDDAIIEAIGEQHYNVNTVAKTDFKKVNKEIKKKFREMTQD